MNTLRELYARVTRKITVEDVLRKQLADALIQRAEAAQTREQWQAHENMLAARIERLNRELGCLVPAKTYADVLASGRVSQAFGVGATQ